MTGLLKFRTDLNLEFSTFGEKLFNTGFGILRCCGQPSSGAHSGIRKAVMNVQVLGYLYSLTSIKTLVCVKFITGKLRLGFCGVPSGRTGRKQERGEYYSCIKLVIFFETLNPCNCVRYVIA